MYNFKKQKSQDFECVYAHDLFCRGKKYHNQKKKYPNLSYQKSARLHLEKRR